MARIVWTNAALDDLDEIAEYISLDNLIAAKKFVKRVFKHVDRLSEHPKSGRVPPELPGSIYREVVVRPCRIFCRMEDKTAYILHIMRSERSLRRFLIDEQ